VSILHFNTSPFCKGLQSDVILHQILQLDDAILIQVEVRAKEGRVQRDPA